MNVLIDLKKISNEKIKNQLISVRIVLIHNDICSEYRGIFKNSEIIFETDINFIKNEKYSIIISLVALGKQIMKGKYTFVYTNEGFQLKEEQINIKISNNKKNNEIKKINRVTLNNYCEYNYRINPLAIVRQENNEKITIFLNGNIYILKGALMKIINKIVHINSLNEIIEESNRIKDIDLLISKGCIICYE